MQSTLPLEIIGTDTEKNWVLWRENIKQIENKKPKHDVPNENRETFLKMSAFSMISK